MNQILVNQKAAESRPIRKNEKADIKSIIRIFCIAIIIIGIIFAGKSVYALTSNKEKKQDNLQVSIEKMGKEATITVTTEKPIKELRYKWNDGEETIISGNETITIEKTIDIPNGNNILKVTVIDYYGNKKNYQKQYIYESSDTTKPTIEIAKSGNKLKLTATDETEISYMTYKWDDQNEVRVEADSSNKTEISQDVEVPKGQTKLTIVAVDSEENKTTRTETIIGDTKPTFTLTTEGQYVVISAEDDEGIAKITITVDNNTTDTGDTPINQKQVTAKIPLESGAHTIKVIVSNINGLEETKELSATI